MRKCPYCAEEIQDEAIKCKHCGSTVPQAAPKEEPKEESNEEDVIDEEEPSAIWSSEDKELLIMYLKWFGKIFLAIIAIIYWYISISIISIWYIWKKTKLTRKKKSIGTAIILGVFSLFMGVSAYHDRTPTILISQPANNTPIKAKEMIIRGTIDPEYSVLSIRDKSGASGVVNIINGTFSYVAKLEDEKNTFKFEAVNNSNVSEKVITINRAFTPEELAEHTKQKAEEEAKQKEKEENQKKLVQLQQEEQKKMEQLAQEAQKKADEEKKAKELAEQRKWEKSKAGKICKAHPRWSRDDCESLADNRIWIGMTLDMLKYKRGLPDSSNPSNYGYGTRWQWCWFDYKPSCFYGGNNGVVESYN